MCLKTIIKIQQTLEKIEHLNSIQNNNRLPPAMILTKMGDHRKHQDPAGALSSQREKWLRRPRAAANPWRADQIREQEIGACRKITSKTRPWPPRVAENEDRVPAGEQH
jgi:hypothetical protein